MIKGSPSPYVIYLGDSTPNSASPFDHYLPPAAAKPVAVVPSRSAVEVVDSCPFVEEAAVAWAVIEIADPCSVGAEMKGQMVVVPDSSFADLAKAVADSEKADYSAHFDHFAPYFVGTARVGSILAEVEQVDSNFAVGAAAELRLQQLRRE